MKAISLLIFLFTFPLETTAAEECRCKCVSTNDEGKFTNVSASGKDREAAGEALKKALGQKKCELSPVCEGDACTLDGKKKKSED